MREENAPLPVREPVEPEKSLKKPYRTPTLTEYGPVQRLTHTGGSVDLADGSQSMRMPCL
jgi:hypothetical protein